jgi:hypothetical protein
LIKMGVGNWVAFPTVLTAIDAAGGALIREFHHHPVRVFALAE